MSGMGAILNHFFMGQGFSNLQVLNLGIPETFLDHGSYKDLTEEIGLTPEKIVKQICSQFGLRNGAMINSSIESDKIAQTV